MKCREGRGVKRLLELSHNVGYASTECLIYSSYYTRDDLNDYYEYLYRQDRYSF